MNSIKRWALYLKNVLNSHKLGHIVLYIYAPDIEAHGHIVFGLYACLGVYNKLLQIASATGAFHRQVLFIVDFYTPDKVGGI